MRNLVLLKQISTHISLPDAKITHTSVDYENNILYAVTESHFLISTSIRNGDVLFEVKLEIDDPNTVIEMQFVADIQTVVIAVSNGDILAIETSNPSQMECIGTIDGGIVAMSWSPDFEVVVFTSGAGKMLMMTQTWDLIFEQKIVPENEEAKITARLAISEPSKIKKETTINDVLRVTEAKTAISAQMELALDSMPSVARSHSITWRGDGQFFAVSSKSNDHDSHSKASQFRVWNRDGTFFTKSESGILTQSSLLFWKPLGDIIASTQSLPTHDEVIFFEKNGLRHYEFAIRWPGARIIDIQWNATSDILSTLLRLDSTNTSSSSTLSPPPSHKLALQFWTTKNYHWYLKHEILFTQDHISLLWDPEVGVNFIVTTNDGLVDQYSFCWDVCQSQGRQIALLPPRFASQVLESNHSVAAVIDGSDILLTSFKYQVVPPPMSTTKIKSDTYAINQFAFSATNRLFSLNSSGTLHYYQAYSPILEKGKPPKFNCPPQLIAKSPPGTLTGIRQLTHFGENVLFCIRSNRDSNAPSDILESYHYTIAESTPQEDPTVDGKAVQTTSLLKLSKISSMNIKPVHRLYHNVDTGTVIVQLLDGSVLKVEPQTNHSEVWIPTLSLCPWIQTAIFGMDEEVVVGLSATNKLFANTTLISSECNSFGLHADYLLFTTLTHRMRVISCHKTIQDNISVLARQSIKYDDSSREVEQGSVIVGVETGGIKVILQMPRGNLEAIEPRSLVLHVIRSQLDAGEYKKAFELMRKQRIDLNLIYDHNPSLLMERIASFLEQVSDIDHLNLFISCLTTEDCTKTTYVDVFDLSKRNLTFAKIGGLKNDAMHSAATLASSSSFTLTNNPSKYVSNIPQKVNQYVQPIHTDDAAIKSRLLPLKVGKEKIVSNKLNQVCDALRQLMESKDPNKYILPILTTLVCKKPAETEKALTMVQTLRKAELGTRKTTETLPNTMTSEKALKYLVFLVDVNDLYNIALGMYDLDLVILVAQKSTKDPREYLPFLADLQKQDAYFQRYNIDAHLGKWDKALQNLAQAGTERFGLCLQLIKDKKLYLQALEMFKGEDRAAVLDLYGDYLKTEKQYQEAIVTYCTGHHIQKAFECAKMDANWKQAISFGYQLGLHQNEANWKATLAEMAAICHNRFKFEDAAILLESYCNKPGEALTILLEGSLWDHAQMICYKHGMVDRIQSELVPALQHSQETLLHTIQEKTVKLTKYHNRLITVRANKYLQSQTESAPFIEGSETSSMYSGSSQSSDISEDRKSTSSKVSKSSKTSKSSKASKAALKKQQKGKISGRKGSPHEEQYLTQELPGLLPSLQIQQEVASTLKYLFQFGFIQPANALQDALQEWIDRGSKALSLINTPSPLTRDEKQDYDLSRATEDSLQLALVDPPKIPNAKLPTITWRLPMLHK